MKYKTRFSALVLAATLIGCAVTDKSFNSPDSLDPRPPLMNNDDFTNFVPTVVTNQLPPTIVYYGGEWIYK